MRGVKARRAWGQVREESLRALVGAGWWVRCAGREVCAGC